MRLTIRGWAAVVVLVFTVGLAWGFGPRALNAIAAPLVAGLLVGVVQVARARVDDVDQEPITPAFPGEERTRTVTVEGRGVATVTARVSSALGDDHRQRTAPLPVTIDQRLVPERRGVYELPPIEVTSRDALGLVASRRTLDPGSEVVVYPDVYPIRGDRRLAGLLRAEGENEPGAFDRLREYVPGDPLRHVDWKASAKHDEYVVMEFAPPTGPSSLTVAADAVPGGVDEMAAAAASVVDVAIDVGVTVSLVLPTEDGHERRRIPDRETALELLARVEDGEVPPAEHEAADVSIGGRPEGATLRFDGVECSFRSLIDDASTDGSRAGVVA